MPLRGMSKQYYFLQLSHVGTGSVIGVVKYDRIMLAQHVLAKPRLPPVSYSVYNE